jgi:hypothetical protein
VYVFLSEAELADAGESAELLAEYGEHVDGGVALVLAGERGRGVFSTAVGVDPMDFAGTAMGTEGDVDADLTGGTCPHAGDGDDHELRFLFAFVEAENEEVGGLYAEGPVVHAYAACTCGETYSDRWVAGTRD